MKLTCVIDNTANFASQFYAEHGLSILIEDGNSKFLFDTGKSHEILEKNMGLLNGFEGLKKVVLSHGHNDHTGGVSCILNNSSADILMHEKTILPKYISRNGEMQFIGPQEEYDAYKSCFQTNNDETNKGKSKVEFISKVTKIAHNIFIFPEISLNNNFEEIDTSFFVKKNGALSHDNFEEEVVLVIKTDHGLIVLSGCAHRGIVNAVSSVAEYFNDNIYAVVGGTHLKCADAYRVKSTINNLKNFEPDILALGHCNGFDASCMFKKEFGNIFNVLESGKKIL